MDYAMSVIIGRALPDVRDGLKPVHRRVLYAMYREGLLSTRAYSKCAGIVGEVLKKYHPHGDAAVYDTLVRMAQDFNLRMPLIDGQGNFGSVDGDPPAAYRYTEARLTALAESMMRDIDKDTVDFVPNFDGNTQEPVGLPSAFPNLLVNGATGIAVGMATNIPPHNLREVVDGILHVLASQTERPMPSSWTRFSESCAGPTFRPRPSSTADQASSRRIAPAGASSRCAPAPRSKSRGRTAESHRRDRDSLPGEQGQAGRENRRARGGTRRSTASPTFATNPIATGCAS